MRRWWRLRRTVGDVRARSIVWLAIACGVARFVRVVRLSVQMMLHHAVDDPFVQYGGCCRSRQCCCAICTDCDVCVSTDTYFTSWAEHVPPSPWVSSTYQSVLIGTHSRMPACQPR